jgi:hypothetical protein
LVARKKKEEKYKLIKESMRKWLGMYKEEITQKYQ